MGPVAAESLANVNRPWLFPRAWSLGLLLLISATWPLWFPGPSSQMPLIPLLPVIPWSSAVTRWTGLGVSILLVLCLLLVIFQPVRYRRVWWLISGCLIISFLVDQHRLQPWAYQSSLYAMVFASMDRAAARRWLIPLAASVYLYSAAGKFDYQFAHTVGQDFLTAATDPIGGIPGRPEEQVRARLALLFPAIEFLAGLGILVSRTRRIAAVLLIAMHIGLIAILGPWNRDHSHGVLLWNGLLIAQAYLLMIRGPKPCNRIHTEATGPQTDSPGARVSVAAVRLIIVAAMAAPLLERHGYWDHWTSWSLYSPHTSHVDLEVHQSAIDRLDPVLQACLLEDTDQDGWQVLDLGSWSLSTRRVPVYPQARYQLALAADLARRYGLSDEIRARLSGVSDRWSGKREQVLMRTQKEIEGATEAFWLLSHPDRRTVTRRVAMIAIR